MLTYIHTYGYHVLANIIETYTTLEKHMHKHKDMLIYTHLWEPCAHIYIYIYVYIYVYVFIYIYMYVYIHIYIYIYIYIYIHTKQSIQEP